MSKHTGSSDGFSRRALLKTSGIGTSGVALGAPTIAGCLGTGSDDDDDAETADDEPAEDDPDEVAAP